jgi:ATP-dependent Lon protease
MLEVLDPN